MQPGGSRGTKLRMNVEPRPIAPAGAAQDEYVLPLRELLGVLGRRLWVILLVATLLAGAAVAFDLTRSPTYEATILILVGQQQDNDETPSQLGSDVQGLQQITQTVAELVATRPVAEAVIERLDLETSTDDFLENLNVQQVGTTQSIEVSYESESPEEARQIANSVGNVFSEQVSEVSASANSITATVWEEAAVPEAPASPNPVRDGLLALILGGMLGVGLAFLLEQFDDRWRSPEEVEGVSGVPTFGVIPEFEVPKGKKGAR